MSRKPQHFAQRDVTRAVNAAKAAGVEVSVVEVQLADGVIIRISGPRGSCDKQNPWDEVLSDAAAGTSIAGSTSVTGRRASGISFAGAAASRSRCPACRARWSSRRPIRPLAGTPSPSTIGATRTRVGTLDALVLAYLHSAAFLALAPSTQRVYRGICERFAAAQGNKPLAGLSRQHLEAMLAKKAVTPAAANNWLQQIKMLTAYGVREGVLRHDPARDIAFLRRKSPGLHTWSEDEIARFEARWPIGSKPRLALALPLYTAQRRGDVLIMGKQHIRDGVVHVRQQKTGAVLAIPVHPRLPHLTFLTSNYGRPFSPGGFSNWFRDRCREAGLPAHCTGHGLRKATARRLAEAGCSANIIASITGHKTLREVERYTKAADQVRMARQGMAAMITWGNTR